MRACRKGQQLPRFREKKLWCLSFLCDDPYAYRCHALTDLTLSTNQPEARTCSRCTISSRPCAAFCFYLVDKKVSGLPPNVQTFDGEKCPKLLGDTLTVTLILERSGLSIFLKSWCLQHMVQRKVGGYLSDSCGRDPCCVYHIVPLLLWEEKVTKHRKNIITNCIHRKTERWPC